MEQGMGHRRRPFELPAPARTVLTCLLSPFLLVWVLLFRREWRLVSVILAYMVGPLLMAWFALTRQQLEITVGAFLWEIEPRPRNFSGLIHFTQFVRHTSWR